MLTPLHIRLSTHVDWFRVLLLALLALLSLSPSSYANSGVSWLMKQADPDKGDYSTAQDVATSFQATVETLRTLFQLETTPAIANSLKFINDQDYQNTERLAHAIVVHVEQGHDMTTLVNELIAMQNPDGGFGEWQGYNSSVLDTALALEALATAEIEDTQVVQAAIGFLTQHQNSDGGFALNAANDSSVYVTAKVSQALQYFLFKFNISAIIEAANAYLYTHLLEHSEDWEIALALMAVVPMTTEASRYSEAVEILKAHQDPNASWGGDVYATALALRIIDYIETLEVPVNPNFSTLSGRVVDANSGLPLGGVAIAIESMQGIQAYTQVDGSFTLANMPPNTYTFNYQLPGYDVAYHSTTVAARQLLNLGQIRLQPSTSTALITGIVSSAVTGQPLSGVLVEATGSQRVSTVTDENGHYTLIVAPGTVTIAIQVAQDYVASTESRNAREVTTPIRYEPVHTTATVEAGDTVLFSPVLTAAGTEASQALTLEGQVIDNETQQPLRGVSVNITDSRVSGTSQRDGHFSLTAPQTGSQQLNLSLAGYQSAYLTVLVQGPTDLGLIRLPQLTTESTTTTTLEGIIVDAQTERPIAGAHISLTGSDKTATSAADGHYIIEGISTLNLSLVVTASGYLTNTQNITQPEHSYITMDIPLKPLGFMIAEVSADQASYPAFSKATINAQLHNRSTADKTVQLMAKVINEAGIVVEHQPISHAPLPDDMADSLVTVAAQRQQDVGLDWSNNDMPPGRYQMIIQAYDKGNWQLLSEASTTLIIEPTRIVDIIITSEPRFSYQGAQADLNFIAEVENHSNTTIELVVGYEFLAPERQVIKHGQATFTLTPEDKHQVVTLETFTHTFTQSGIYRLDTQILSGELTGGGVNGIPMTVAPGVHIIPHKDVTPLEVVPDGDKRIHLNIQIEGGEEE